MQNLVPLNGQPALREEIVQSYIRISFVLVVFVVISKADAFGFKPATTWQYCTLSTFLLWAIFYLFFIKVFPARYCIIRRYASVFIDLAIASLMFVIVGNLSAVFPAIFLWLIVGYGMRYGTMYSNAAMVGTTIFWGLIYKFSPYWNASPCQSIGWLVAFWVVPLYFFVIVRRLHLNLKKLSLSLAQTEQVANYDNLTQLANRSYFDQQLEQFIKKYDHLSIMIMDLDGFKRINDTFGHKQGDVVLCNVAELLRRHCDSSLIAGRLGGDEFILCSGGKTRTEVDQLCTALLLELQAESDQNNSISASIGISFFPEDGDDISHVKGFADAAMYQAKKQGKNRHVFYTLEN